MALSLAACGGSSEDTTDTAKTTASTAAIKGGKTLVLNFSAANTSDADAVTSATPLVDGKSSVAWIADLIAEGTGSDVVPIIPEKDYPLDYDEVADAAKEEADKNARPAFQDLGVDPADYDVIFLGYPIWWYTTPMIIETLLETYDFSGKTIIPFNTHAGSQSGGTFELIQEREPDATVLEGLSVSGSNAGSDSAKSDVTKWLQGLDLD